MPLRLKSFELHGYKTFAAKFNFEFAEGITAIVGPNGSGKSNIADALRWVLGEQSYSLLRAKKTEDMIFAGSEQRPRAGMASATVVFDNADGWLPVDFSEVGLSRRAYRDGRNEYLLNSQHVRLKDINELLAQSGLSERTYTILGQGLVDASLALKADERRRLFEEAAGIGLYRARREEALRRLETTRRNLDRVLDILAELEPRLRSLERQATRAQEHAQVQSDLRLLLREWYGYHWHRAQFDLTEVMDATRAQEVRLSESRETYQGVRTNFSTFRDQLNGLRVRLNSWHRQSAQIHASRETFSRDLAMSEERQRAMLDNRARVLAEIAHLEDEIKVASENLSEFDVSVKTFQSEAEEARTQFKTSQEALNSAQAERTKQELDLGIARKENDDLAARRASALVRKEELALRSASQQEKLASADLENSAYQAELEEAEAGYARQVELRKHAEGRIQKAKDGLENLRRQSADLEGKVKSEQKAHAEAQAERARWKAQLGVLEQAEQSLSGYAEGAKRLLEAGRKAELNGVKGALSTSLDVPVELEAAIAAALGEYTDAVLLKQGADADQALSLLEGGELGRASILPLDWLKPGVVPTRPEGEDVLGIASDLVRAPAELRPAVDLLLGQVLVVCDRQAARKALASHTGVVRVVTLKGEVFYTNGPIVAGNPGKVSALGRPRQKREITETIAATDSLLAAVEAKIHKLSGQLETAEQAVHDQEDQLAQGQSEQEAFYRNEQSAKALVESAMRKWEWQKNQKAALEQEMELGKKESVAILAGLAGSEVENASGQERLRKLVMSLEEIPLGELQEQVTYWTARLAVADQSVSMARVRYGERKQAVGHLESQLKNATSKLEELEKGMETTRLESVSFHQKGAEFNAQLDELARWIEPAEKELECIEREESDYQRKENEEQAALARVERFYNQLQLDLGRKQEALVVLRGKIEDDFGLVNFEYAADVSGPVPLPLDGMVEQLPIVTELAPDLEENLLRQRAQLRRMGAINPEAQAEFLAVKERHLFLTSQMDDLHKAEADLHQVIAELDELTRREFQKTFDAVAEQFHTIFHRLFGGGAARLVLTDPANLTETGIDIEARLPGRREQGLSLLSGGERSLTAIALVFALLKVSPTPVCVMDEVDAMLDEANVGRFRDLLAELSKETQFVIITHNRNTVQAADVIYGVTMGRDSASQVISLKLDEVSDEFLK